MSDRKNLFCKKCNRKTEHIESGFENYNRRMRCMECSNEVLWTASGQNLGGSCGTVAT